MFGAPPTPAAYRRIITTITVSCLVVAAAGVVLFGGLPATATGQSDVSVDSLSVADENTTVDGDVSDVLVDATVGYDHDIADAEERIIELRAGPSEAELTTLTFDRAMDPATDDSGTVTLSGSLLEAGFTAEDFTPEYAGATTQEVVVQVVLEIDRATGETVERTATETATITVTDDGEITATVGGEAGFTVEAA